jgi:arsenate reductase
MNRILFVCQHNSCRSQMAEGFARHLGGDGLAVVSAGLEPRGVDTGAIAVMAEAGIDISQQRSQALSEFQPEAYDAAISLCGCGVNLPQAWLLRPIFQDWAIADPAGQPLEAYRQARDGIRERVETLLARLPAAQG